MKDKMYQMYLDRAKLFFKRSMNDLFFETQPLTAEFSPSKDPVYFQDRLKGKYRAIKEGDHWGETWDSAWFHVTGSIPKSWAQQPVALWCDFNGEALIFDATGMPLFSLTDSSVFAFNYCKPFYQLPFKIKGGEKLDYWIETAANGLFGLDMDGDPSANCPKPYGDRQGILKTLKVGRFNLDLWHLRLDFEVLLGLVEALPAGDYRALRTIDAMNEAVNVYAENPANAKAARQPLRRILDLPAMASAMTVTAVGHAHIDTGWLWPVRESIRKCARTFASQVHNIEKYPGYVFGASSPQHYAFTKQHYPELYRKIKKYVKDGRWELQGGMWVEADCNLASGESLVRQFLHGKNFYRDEFGVEVKNLWLPDVFGYSAALPQIMKLAGCDFFLTQKLSWSEINRFPHHSFRWRGLGGAEVIAHFPPEDNYNAYLEPAALRFAEDNFQENSLCDEFLTLFGAGDGGGGPKMEHIEAGLREADLEDVPRLSFGRAADFFERLRTQQEKLPLWDGELYFEFHRGTLTNQGRIKRGNRMLEQKFIATEMLLALAPPEAWPRETLDAMWKRFLMYQFHDILPGTSIAGVHAEALAGYRELSGELDRLAGEAARTGGRPDPECLTLFQSLATPYDRLLRLPDSWRGCGVGDADGGALPVQEEPGGVFVRRPLPPLSFTTLRKTAPARRAVAEPFDGRVLENDLVRYEFRDNGELVRAFDKRGNREFLTADGGNRLLLYVDRARIFEGWEVEISDRDIPPERARATAPPRGMRGPLHSSLRFETAIGNSTIVQTAVLEADSLRLDFLTAVNFHEERRMLRASFATTVPANEAVCDIQHGFLRRPVHRNTSWDLARFEFAAHRYVDCSDDRGGVALLNDGKYGYSAGEGLLELSLLRSPVHPDAGMDAGLHEFTYSFLPHAEPFADSEVIAEAAALNRPPLPLEGCSAAPEPPFSLDGDGVVTVEAFKRAEKGDDRILRLLERRGMHGAVRLRAPGLAVSLCDLLEWEEGEPLAPDATGAVTLDFRPFELKTLRLKPRPDR